MAESVLKITGIRDAIYDHQLELRRQVPGGADRTPRLIIFDGESAVMGINPDDTSVGAVVHHSQAIVRMAEELFLSYWHRAVDPFEEKRQARQGGISAQETNFSACSYRARPTSRSGGSSGCLCGPFGELQRN